MCDVAAPSTPCLCRDTKTNADQNKIPAKKDEACTEHNAASGQTYDACGFNDGCSDAYCDNAVDFLLSTGFFVVSMAKATMALVAMAAM